MTYIIDRIEDGIATLEIVGGDETIDLPRKELPKGAREGHVLRKDRDVFTIDYEETEKRRKNMRARLDKLLKKR